MKKGVDYIGVGVGAVIVDRQGKIFLSKRGKDAYNEKGKWECPGGAMHLGETFEQTIIREIQEEFGFTIIPIKQLEPFNHLIPEEKQHWVALCFISIIKKGKPIIVEKNKCEEIGWFTLSEMEKMELTTATRHRLKQLKEKYPNGLPSFYER